jgi:hypothetical protein
MLYREVNMLSDAYIAGLIDGEGSIGIIATAELQKQRWEYVRFRLRVAIGMQNKNNVLDNIKEKYGGTLSYSDNIGRLVIANERAYVLLRNIKQYSIVKKDEISLAIKYYEYREKNRSKKKPYFSKESIKEFYEYKNRLSLLKKYAVPYYALS